MTLEPEICQHERVATFDAEAAIIAGGWHPVYARVIDLQTDGDVAAALVDANGDGTDLNVGIYALEAGQWAEVASGNGSISAPGLAVTWTDDDRLVLTRTSEDID